MSLIIKGMRLPRHANCNGKKDTVYRCIILAHPDNSVELVIDTEFTSAYDNGHNIQRYSLAEIPTPHGRLIDADRLLKVLSKNSIISKITYANGDSIEDIIRKAPTIIEAEVEV